MKRSASNWRCAIGKAGVSVVQDFIIVHLQSLGEAATRKAKAANKKPRKVKEVKEVIKLVEGLLREPERRYLWAQYEETDVTCNIEPCGYKVVRNHTLNISSHYTDHLF